MRLIGTVENEKQAFIFYSYLLQMNIHSTYEPYTDPDTKKEEIRIWVYEEDAVFDAIAWLEEFKQNPQGPRFADIPLPFVPPQPPDLIAEIKKEERQKQPPRAQSLARQVGKAPHVMRATPMTSLIILLCVFLFIWNGYQQGEIEKKEGEIGAELSMTPLDQKLLFDYPKQNQEIDQLLSENPPPLTAKSTKDLPSDLVSKIQAIQAEPSWKGAASLLLKKIKGESNALDWEAPKFVKIREGEVWRLFTPALMHGNLLHILFNMAWAWLLLKMLENKLSRFKLLCLILIIGITANVAQYLMSGPLFLGFSGIIVGLVGFIWMRQKIAPWEGYPLHRSTIYFVLIFVAAMLAIDLIAFAVSGLGLSENVIQIANTAHIVGGLTGIFLGKLPFFSRGMP